MSGWLEEDELAARLRAGAGGGAAGSGRGLALRVAAIVPLARELGGAGEVLAVAAFGSARLPAGEPHGGESLFAAARRIVWQTAGAPADGERLIYLVERSGRELTFCVLCALSPDEELEDRDGVRFVGPAAVEEFEPAAIRELLNEDLRQGFVRPLAHIVLTPDENGRDRAHVQW